MDRREVRGVPRHRDDREAELRVEPVEVDHVEPADDRPVQEDRPEALEASGVPNEPRDLGRPIVPVHPDPAQSDRLDPGGDGHRDRGDRGPGVLSRERPVVDADHMEVGLAQGATQG